MPYEEAIELDNHFGGRRDALVASALSRSIDRDIEFPKGYDEKKAEAIRKVIRNENYEFVDGIVSYWPPDWGTRLSFKGDAAKLNSFMSELRELKGISMRLILYRGRNDESRRDSPGSLTTLTRGPTNSRFTST